MAYSDLTNVRWFKLWTTWRELFDRLSNDQAGMLIRAIYAYVCDGEIVQLDPAMDMVFSLLRGQLDADANDIANGKKGGRPKNQGLGEENPGLQTKTKTKTKDKDKEKDKDKDRMERVDYSFLKDEGGNE